MVVHVGGWNIWAKHNDKLRQFTVAEPAEEVARETLLAAHPGIEILSRHMVDTSLIRFLGLAGGGIIEWVPADPSHRLTRAGGVPINKPVEK